VWAERTIVEC